MKIFQFRVKMQRPIQSANEHRNSQDGRHAWVLGCFPGRSHLTFNLTLHNLRFDTLASFY